MGLSDVTGFPEIMDGRCKNFNIQSSWCIALCSFQNPGINVRQLQELGIEYIDLVCVNLYPFKETVLNQV